MTIDAATSSEVQANTEGDAAGSFTELDETSALIAWFESVETITVCWREDLTEEVQQLHTQKVSIREESSRKNADNLLKDLKLAKAEIVITSIKRNLICARFKKHERAQHWA